MAQVFAQPVLGALWLEDMASGPQTGLSPQENSFAWTEPGAA